MNTLNFIERHNSDSEKWRKYAGQDVIPAWVADIDCAAADPILSALRDRLAHGVFGYSSPLPLLAETACAYFQRRWSWHIKPEWILYSPGLGAGIHNGARMAAGGAILTPQPIYHVFRKAPALAGATRSDMPMAHDGKRWQLPAEAMHAALTAGNNRIFQLCNPHNPNGKVYSKDELLAIGEFCCRHDLLIFADEVHADLILDPDAVHIPIASLAPEIAARTITMQSPSKAYNIAGLNFAFIIISDDTLRKRYHEAGQGKILSNLNPFGFAAAAAAYGGDCDEWLRLLIQHLRANRDMLQQAVDGMDGITMTHLASTYLAWLNVAELNLDDAPAHFLRHGLGLSPGANFGDKRYMRLNFGCSRARLQEITDRLGNAVQAAR